MAAALTNVGIVRITDREKFLRILPTSQAERIQSNSLVRMRTTRDFERADELFPPGVVDFAAAKGAQVAKVYAEIIGKKLDQSSPVPAIQDFVCRTTPALTRAEIIYALDVHFAWRGYKMVAVDDKTARLVPLDEKL